MASRRSEKRRLPTESEINVHDSLDERAAVRNFVGKTVEEIEAECRAGVDITEDLMFMGPRAFCYYVRAIVNYLISDASARNRSACLAFLLCVVEHRLEFPNSELAPAWPVLLEGVEYVLDHYEKFDVVPEYCSDLRPQYQEANHRLRELVAAR